MLRKAQTLPRFHVDKEGIFHPKLRVTVKVGRQAWHIRMENYELSRRNWEQYWQASAAGQVPMLIVQTREKGTLWKWRDGYFWETEGFNDRQVYALLVQREQRELRKATNAEAVVFGQVGGKRVTRRAAIPDDVKQLVWARDGGRCVLCGSDVELQFGHIIPAAWGGGNGPDNLQLECGPCNRNKGAALA
jgi:hypothetical protein